MSVVLGRLKVGQRLWISVGLAVGAIALVLLLVLVQFRDSQMAQRQAEIRGLVETAYAIIEHHGRLASAATLSPDEAKTQSAAVIRSLGYGESGYFWINDTAPTMVMHPHKPELNGKNLAESKDPNGKRLFVSFVETAKAKPEGGIVEYVWPKPGSSDPVQKISYVKLYGPWGWVIGTGVYVDDINAAFWRKTAILGVIVAGIAMLLVLVSMVVQRSILAPIRKLEHAVCVVAEHGDLTIRADIDQRGELGSMGYHFDGMLERLQQFVSEVGEAAGTLASASTELSVITEQTQGSVETQRSQTTHVATAMTEMSATVSEIAGSAASTADAARDADARVSDGAAVVSDASRTIERLAVDVQQMGNVISELEQDSAQIGKVLEVIQSIAEQTNLLALNAAIEAARAGEQGRGFAVVADEVRGLAKRTQKSTSEIQEMIQTLQGRAHAAVSAMDNGQKQAEMSVQRAQAAVASLGLITDSVARISDMSTQIATASEEQSAVAEDVNHSMIQIDQSASETMSSATEIASASRSLAELAERLRTVSSQLRG